MEHAKFILFANLEFKFLTSKRNGQNYYFSVSAVNWALALTGQQKKRYNPKSDIERTAKLKIYFAVLKIVVCATLKLL